MTRVLLAAAAYNLLWGIVVVLFPTLFFRLAGMAPPLYPPIWQCVGMIVGVYGIGYAIAAADPYRHWPIVLVGLLGKIFGPIGFLQAAGTGTLPWRWGVILLTNDLIWWFPFAAILYFAFRHSLDTARSEIGAREEEMQAAVSHRGARMADLAKEGTLLVVFLRHAGCTFCRESVADVAHARAQIEARGVRIALVHLGNRLTATQLTSRHQVDDLHRFADPECRLYRAFGLGRGSLWQLFGPRMWPGAARALWYGHGLGRIAGDGFRMPGAFVLSGNRVLATFRHESPSDRPDYEALLARAMDSRDDRSPSERNIPHRSGTIAQRAYS